MRVPSWPTFLSCVALLCLAQPSAAAPEGVRQITLSSARQVEPGSAELRAYLKVLDNQDASVTDVEGMDLSATLGAEPLRLNSLKPFPETGEGVAFVFLVDISKSLSRGQFSQIQDALRTWISGLREKDYAAIVAFGEMSRTVVDFTQDSDQLIQGLESLGPTDNLTVLHKALQDSLRLSRRQDPNLPGRRALILLTDGLDEGSGLAIEDVLGTLREDPVPIYTIGYSQLPEPGRSRYLQILHRLASNSGGAFFRAERTRFAEAYGSIRKAIDEVLTAELECPACRPDGRTYRLQINLSADGQTVSDGRDLRLLPPVRFPGQGAPDSATPSPDQRPAAGVPGGGPSTPGTGNPQATSGPSEPITPWYTRFPAWVWAVTVGLLAALILVLLSGRRRSTGSPEGVAAAEQETSAAAGTAAPSPTDDLSRLPERRPVRPTRPVPLRLVVVRGSRKGKEYRIVLRESATVGARSSCDCILADESNISPTQFELLQQDGQVLVRNLAEVRPTKLGGLPLKEARRVKSGSLIGNDDTILRVVFEG